MELNKIYHGNNLDILKTFPDNSIDSIVTDPPYGLGKEPNAVEVLQSWITTGYHEIIGKGFMGKEWDSFVPQPIFWKECLRVLKPGGYLLSFAGTRTYDWVVMGLRLSGFEIRDMIAWLYGQGFPKSHDVEKAINKMDGVEFDSKPASGVGFMKPDSEDWHQTKNQLTQKGESSDRAKQWQGYGTALKPALEPIVMARKPLIGTVASNVLKYGTGGINIDGCRVGTEEINIHNAPKGTFAGGESGRGSDTESYRDSLGRFPANLIHDGSAEVVEGFPSEAGGGLRNSSNNKKTEYTNTYTPNEAQYSELNTYGDSGSAARFFYTPKASQSERNFGLSGFESKFTAAAEFRPNHMEKAIDGESGNPFGRWQPKKNIHPTVKPIDLMQYLVRLVTPRGGICLDPFMGSGTTAVACKSEKVNYIGCELEQDYINIAEARIKAEVVMFDIFDFGA